MRKSIGGTTARLGDRRRRKMTENTVEEDSLDGIPPGDYMDGQMESMTNSTGRGWKEIGDGRRRKDWQIQRRGDWLRSVKLLKKREKKSRSGIKKMKWETLLTPWENCKIVRTTNLEKGVMS